jgi:hypothetical protein
MSTQPRDMDHSRRYRSPDINVPSLPSSAASIARAVTKLWETRGALESARVELDLLRLHLTREGEDISEVERKSLLKRKKKAKQRVRYLKGQVQTETRTVDALGGGGYR